VNAPLLYKILHTARFAESERDQRLAWADVDLRDGFVHLSTAAQVRETARLHFAGQHGLVLVAVDPARLLPGTLRFEASRDGALFPHVYGDVPLAAIAWSAPLPLGEDGFDFPSGIGA
jgi:uncharacterized protein (DUF952 family)